MSSSLPPIASPHGHEAINSSPRPDEKCARITVALRWLAVFRYGITEWLMPINLVVFIGGALLIAVALLVLTLHSYGLIAIPIVFVSSFVFLFVLSAPIALFIRLCSKRRFEIWFSEAGVFKRFVGRDVFFPWRKFVWVIERKGDVWLVSFADGCFIPRESFSSREEAHEFATTVRELKHTLGSGWNDDWSGRVFGISSRASL